MSQSSVLGPLLLLIYINNLHCAIKYPKVHHFADGTNLTNIETTIKAINKEINHDLKNLSNCLNSNEISLDVSKAELVMSNPYKKQLDHQLKIKVNGKRFFQNDSG